MYTVLPNWEIASFQYVTVETKITTYCLANIYHTAGRTIQEPQIAEEEEGSPFVSLKHMQPLPLISFFFLYFFIIVFLLLFSFKTFFLSEYLS